MKRNLSVSDILKKKHTVIDFKGVWHEVFGVQEKRGTWLVWGNSTNGKTSFVMQLARELAKTESVGYCSFEEQGKMSMQEHLRTHNMQDVAKGFSVLPDETLEGLTVRLKKRRSPDIVVVDSIQHAGLEKKGYLNLKKSFPDKLFILVSHAEGKNPEGSTAKFVKYDATLKIWVEGFKAFVGGRVQGGKPFVIYEKEAIKYWGHDH